MADQFIVPQFLDVEAKIIGPVTGRQFIIMLVMLFLNFLIFRLIPSGIIAIPAMILVSTLCIAFAFAKVNGQPFHYIFLNMIQTFRRPMLRVWDKALTDAEVKERMFKAPEEKAKESIPAKQPLSGSRLSQLSLIVNTGGAYHSESEEQISYGAK